MIDDQALRDDVSRLGHLLGETLEQLEGKSVFAHVELARRTARERRDGIPGSDARFERVLHGLSPAEAMSVSRAFSSYFGLVNLAERVHRVRRWRDAYAHGETVGGSFESVLERLRDHDDDAASLDDAIGAVCFKPVFTAHPTQAVRRTVLVKEQRIAEHLLEGLRERPFDEVELAARAAPVRDEIALAWQTDENFAQPSVADEVEHVLFYLSNVLYPALPALYRRLAMALERVYGRTHSVTIPERMVRLGSWVGGDMDGNPNVNAGTIVSTLERQRELIVERYANELRELFDHLSQSHERIEVSAPLADRLEHYLSSLSGVAERIPERYRDMPYRMFMWTVWHRLGATLDDHDDGYRAPRELIADLDLVHESLRGHGGTGAQRVHDLRLRVRCFGFHLVALDVRQDASVHRAAVAEALARPDFENLPSEERAALLRGALGDARPEPRGAGETLERCLDVMAAIARCLQRFGPEAIGLYIVSMARHADDALAVLYLSRLAAGDRAPQLDIAPLFETVDDLERSPSVLDELLSDPVYAAHLEARGGNQFVMLGYSDSNKQAGIVSSRHALHQAQRALIERVSRRADVDLTLFHGRGGTISRGGGETRNGVLAEPPGALAGTLRVTEQGEIIGQKYGLPEVAVQTMELALGALLERRVADALEPPVDSDWYAAAEMMAGASRDAYRRLISDPLLEQHFRVATPIDVIERLRIGSRPPSRAHGTQIDDLRAIPWVFAWTQSRYSLTGWYGLGHGLGAAIDAFGIESVRAMVRGWRFFATLLSDAEMVLAKSDMGIARLYASLGSADGASMHARLHEEFERTRSLLGEVLEQDRLLARNPTLAHTLALRDPYVDPLHLIQVDYLARWRESERGDPALERVLAETVRGIARGMQNTG